MNQTHVGVLLALAEQPSHGYVLRNVARDRDVSQRSVYRALAVLEAAGLLTSRWETHSRGPARRVYRLTARGEDAVDTLEQELTTEHVRLNNLLMQCRRVTRRRATRA